MFLPLFFPKGICIVDWDTNYPSLNKPESLSRHGKRATKEMSHKSQQLLIEDQPNACCERYRDELYLNFSGYARGDVGIDGHLT